MVLITDRLIGRLYFELKPNEEHFIQVNNIISHVITIIQIETGSISLVYEVAIDPVEYFAEPGTTYATIAWEPLQNEGSSISPVTSSQTSLVFDAPSVIHIKNNGTGIVRVSFTITLPSGASIAKTYTINNSSPGNIFIQATSATIEDQAIQQIPSESAVTIYFNGSNWRFI